jgi:uncharacterized membrane protein
MAKMEGNLSSGVGLLFAVNLAGIFFAAALTFTLLGFKPDYAD